ncbi:hypothetical protein Tco_1109160 [Tanacetum coccineum]
MQKAVLKQQFEAFTISSKESLEKGYDRFQKLLSQLDALGAGVSDEDANHKFLRSLPPAWDSLAMTMRTKKNIDTLSIDDLYNNLSVFEQDIQKTSSSSLTSDNVAFLSQAKASSSKHKPSHSSGEAGRGQDFKPVRTEKEALMTIDEGQINWVEQTTDEELNHALMAFTMNNEVSMCSKLCLDSYNALQAKYDELQSEFGNQEAALVAHKIAVKKLESQLKASHKQQSSLTEKLNFQANQIFEKDEKLKKYRRIGMKAVKDKDALQQIFDSWSASSKNLWKLIDCGMSSTVKIGLGYGIKSNAEVLGYEEEISRGIFAFRETNAGYNDIPLYSRFKQVEYKGVPHPLSGDYTPREQEDIDDSLYEYGKYGPQPQSPSPIESDASSTVYSTCQSNDSDGEQGTVSDHSVNDDPIPIPSIEQVTTATQKTQPQVPKPQQTVDPSCAQHVKTPRQPIRTPVTPSPIPSYNRQNWNQRMERELGAGYSFERKPCFVCGSLSHLIKDCDYYEKKMAREAAFKSTRVVHANVRQATPAWTNSNRVNKANQFTPRPVQLNNIRPNLSTASNTIKTGRVNVNTGKQNVSSGSLHVSSGTHIKSGASSFNTGKQHVNSGSVHVNSGTQFKSGASRFNTGKQHVNSGRMYVNSGTQNKSGGSRVNTGKQNVNEGYLPRVSKMTTLVLLVRIGESKQGSCGVLGFCSECDGEVARWGCAGKAVSDWEGQSINNNVCECLMEIMKVRVCEMEDAVLMDGSSTSLSEKIVTKKTHSQRQPSSTPISKSAEDIMTFRKELDALALKHLGPVPTTVSTSTNPVNTGSINLNTTFEEVNTDNLEAISPSADHERAEILKKFDLVHVKAAITPMETKLPLTKDEEAFDVDVHLYRSMIGSLMYLTASRPDIMYAVVFVARFQVTPKTSHLNAVNEDLLFFFLRYLQAKPILGLWYLKDCTLDWKHSLDSDYGGSILTGYPQQIRKGDARINLDWEKKMPVVTCQLDANLVVKIVDFLRRSKLRYALTHNPPIYDSLVKQFWQTATARTLEDGIQQLNATIDSIEYTITEESVRRQLQLAMLQGINCQPQPSADPTPSHVQLTATTPPTQPVQTTSSPPVSTIPDIQPTLPPSPQIPSPSYHDTEGPSFEPSYHMSPPPSHEPEIQASRSSEESEQLRNLMDIVPRLESRVKSLEKELSETKQTLGTEIFKLNEKVKKLEDKLRKKRKSKEKPLKKKGCTGQVNTAEVNTAELNAVSTPSAQVNTAEVDTAALNTGETERDQRRKGKEPMTLKKTSSMKFRASKKLKSASRARDLEEAKDEKLQEKLMATDLITFKLRLNADSRFLLKRCQQEEKGEVILLREELSSDMTKLTAKGSFFAEPKEQDQTFVAIGSEEDERAIKKMNEKDADKEEEKKDESVHEEVQEEEGAKKRKLAQTPDEDKVIDAESLDHQYPIIEWQSFFLTTKPQSDQTKPNEDIYLNKVTRSNGHQRFFRTLMGVLSILDREDLKVIYELVMEEYKDKLPEGFDKMLWGDLMIMFNQGDTADFWDTQQNWKLISWKLHSSSGEESSMALELIKFVKQQLEEFEDSNDDDTVTSTHEDAERV